jgi:hypothetical protein
VSTQYTEAGKVILALQSDVDYIGCYSSAINHLIPHIINLDKYDFFGILEFN